MKISQITKDRRTVEIDIDGESLNVTYKPSTLTPEVEDGFMSSVDNNRSGGAMAGMLSMILIDWDLEDDKGQALPVEESSLRVLPITFLGDVLRGIFADMRPNAPKRSNSKGGSLVKG